MLLNSRARRQNNKLWNSNWIMSQESFLIKKISSRVIGRHLPFLSRLLVPLFYATGTTNDMENTLVLVLSFLNDFVAFVVSDDPRALQNQIPIASI